MLAYKVWCRSVQAGKVILFCYHGCWNSKTTFRKDIILCECLENTGSWLTWASQLETHSDGPFFHITACTLYIVSWTSPQWSLYFKKEASRLINVQLAIPWDCGLSCMNEEGKFRVLQRWKNYSKSHLECSQSVFHLKNINGSHTKGFQSQISLRNTGLTKAGKISLL